jgi:spore maturation protein CgeB
MLIIFSTKDKISSSRYFYSAGQSIFNQIYYITNQKEFDLIKTKIKKKDIFLLIDPTNDFPLGLEKIECLKIVYLIDTHINMHLNISNNFQLNHRLIISNFFDSIFIYYKKHLNIFIKFQRTYKKRNHKKNVFWSPLACEPNLHYQNLNNKRNYDIAFIGQMGPENSFRHKFLKEIYLSDKLINLKKKYANNISDKLMSKIYGRTKIVTNVSMNKDINMRYYETMAAGSLLLTNKIRNNRLEILFKENIDYVTYKDKKDAIKKINYYLNNPSIRKRIAKNGQKKVLNCHTYKHRLQRIIKLSKNLKNNSSSTNFNSIKLGEEYSKIYCILRKPKQLLKVIQIYGINFLIIKNFFFSILRFVNVRIPLTRNAIRYYFFQKKLKKLYYRV